MIKKFFWGLTALMVLFACKPEAQPDNNGDNGKEKEKEPETETVTLTAPVLTVSAASIEVDPESEEAAIALSWTSAGEGATYMLEYSIGAQDVSKAVDGLSYTFTHKMLAEEATPPYQMNLKIKASATGASDVYSNAATVSVTAAPQKPALPEHLYIYFWAWDNATNAKEMTKVSDGVFTWTGDCVQWEFKFLTSNADPDDYWTGYFRDPNATEYWTMIESTHDNQCMFMLNDVGLPGGNYTITADLNTLKVTVEKNQLLPEHLYIYFWEWNNVVEGAQEMTNLGEGKFTWSGRAPRWEFKFLTAKEKGDDYWTGYFRDPDAEDYWTIRESNQEVMFKLGEKGFRDGYYTINVDLNTLKVTVIPHIWLIGSAFSWGWTLADAQEMTYTGDGAFTWSGHMYSGIFKFLVVPDEWWGYWRDANAAEYWTATENGDGDVQFDVATEGNYNLAFNVLTKIVSLTAAE